MMMVLLLLLLRGPAMVFLFAKLKSQTVLIKVGKDKISDVVLADYTYGSLRPKTKAGGYYVCSSGTITPTRRGRIPIAIAYDQLAATVNPQLALLVKQIQKYEIPYIVEEYNEKTGEVEYLKKNKITNIIDLQDFEKYVKAHREKIEFDMMEIEDKKTHIEECRACSFVQKGVMLPQETVDITGLSNWADKSITPSIIDTIVETNLRIRMLQNRSIDTKWLILLPLILIGSGVFLVMISNLLASPPDILGSSSVVPDISPEVLP